MKLFIITSEFPYPTNHGGKYDMWSIIKSLKELGNEIFLLTWFEIQKNDVPSDEEVNHVKSVVDQLVMFRIPRNMRRILNLVNYPSAAAARMLDDNSYKEVLSNITSFSPDAILVGTLYPGAIGLKFAKDLSIPVYVRQQNIEHEYMQGQFKLARTLKEKAVLLTSVLHLKQYENFVLSNVNGFFDISVDDLSYWQNKGYKNGHWLPPIYLGKQAKNTSKTQPIYDVAYFGNLNSPNNVKSVFWFIEEVLPHLKQANPSIKVLIAGSKPTSSIEELCNGDQAVTLIPNPDDIKALYCKTKILINPAQFGSGVNLKTIEMLFEDHPVVSTSIGVKGLSKNMNTIFKITDNPIEFANFILDFLAHQPKNNDTERVAIRDNFRPSILNNVLKIMSKSV